MVWDQPPLHVSRVAPASSFGATQRTVARVDRRRLHQQPQPPRRPGVHAVPPSYAASCSSRPHGHGPWPCIHDRTQPIPCIGVQYRVRTMVQRTVSRVQYGKGSVRPQDPDSSNQHATSATNQNQKESKTRVEKLRQRGRTAISWHESVTTRNKIAQSTEQKAMNKWTTQRIICSAVHAQALADQGL